MKKIKVIWLIGIMIIICMTALIILNKDDMTVVDASDNWFESVEESDDVTKMCVDIGGSSVAEKYIVWNINSVPDELCREGLHGYKAVSGSQLSTLIIQGNAVALCSEFKQCIPNKYLLYTYYGTDLNTGIMYFGTKGYYKVYPDKIPDKF